MSKKIALVANTSWSIYNFRLSLIKFLRQNGLEIVVIAPEDSYSNLLISEGIKFESIKLDNYGFNPFNDIRFGIQLYKIYKKHKFDLILHYTIKPNIYGSIAAFLARKKSIAITTGLGHLFNFQNTYIQKLILLIYRFSLKYSSEVWFLNEEDRNTFLKYNIAKTKNTYILPSEGIDTDFFKPKKNKNDHQSLKFLFAGRIIYDKGFHEFIYVARQIKAKFPNIEFNVVGFIDPSNPNSVPYEYIKQLISENVINYLGETIDIRPYFENTDCLIFPSKYGEGVSRIILEAASMETPVITTNNVGCAILVEDSKTGFIVMKGNQNELYTTVLKFIALPYEDRVMMGKNARTKIEKEFNSNKINNLVLERINTLLNNQKYKI